MAGRMAMSACFRWEPIVAQQYAVQNCAGYGRSGPFTPSAAVSAVGVEGGSPFLGGYEERRGVDDAELAKPP